MKRSLCKSSTDQVFAGVCGGIAEYLGISSLAVRLLFIFVSPSIILYIILALYLPEY
ncbi:PspC domain-containing protein [Amphibacillus indicireducens]|uniref:Phage shock protein PspC N-terminal domain-containing protein n=1 Tax=Amphibacillus indicireducens TaxID=1076330 RepID=A0ABP7W1Y4_9BACI